VCRLCLGNFVDMWDLTQEILIIRPSEIEFQNDFTPLVKLMHPYRVLIKSRYTSAPIRSSFRKVLRMGSYLISSNKHAEMHDI